MSQNHEQHHAHVNEEGPGWDAARAAERSEAGLDASHPVAPPPGPAEGFESRSGPRPLDDAGPPTPPPDADEASAAQLAARRPGGAGSPRPRRRGRQLVAAEDAARATRTLSAEQRLLILDVWQRSGLPARDFAGLVGVSHHTLYAWKRRFEELGPAGLSDRSAQRRASGSRLPEPTRRAILMLKQANPEWGCQRISDVLYRGPGLAASATAVARVLKEAGYVTQEHQTSPHPDKVRRFERAASNQLWQTDLFTFVLKRQNRRVYLVAFMDDHSRFIVGFGLHASQSASLVLEVFRAAVTSCGVPQEVLTDNGTQYVTWRGKSRFSRELERRGVKHIVATPRRPQTLGKIERFWGTLWRECLEAAVFVDLADARDRIGLFIDHYNFQRPHQGIDGLTPADRFFGAAPQMLETLKARVDANALVLARNGVPRAPFYVAGHVGGKPFSVHAEGERVIMLGDGGERQEVELTSPHGTQRPTLPPALSAQGIVQGCLDDQQHEPDRGAPGTSPLDEGLLRLAQSADVADETPPTPPAQDSNDSDDGPADAQPETGGAP